MKTEALDKAIIDQKELLADIQKMDVTNQPCADTLLVAKKELIESICNNINYLMRIRDSIAYGVKK